MLSSPTKFFIIIFLSTLLSIVCYADPNHAGHGKGHGWGHKFNHGKSVKKVKSTSQTKFPRFSKTDKTTIHNFFDKNPISASTLPPGIAMNVARGKPLPPGIAKKVLPNDLLSALPPPRPGYEYLAVGKDIVLVDTTSKIIADVLTLK